jgi:hypothetical protein
MTNKYIFTYNFAENGYKICSRCYNRITFENDPEIQNFLIYTDMTLKEISEIDKEAFNFNQLSCNGSECDCIRKYTLQNIKEVESSVDGVVKHTLLTILYTDNGKKLVKTLADYDNNQLLQYSIEKMWKLNIVSAFS